MKDKNVNTFKKLYVLKKEQVKFYLDSNSITYYQVGGKAMQSLETLTINFQIPFFIIFIQNHELASKLSILNDPIEAIDIFLRDPFLNGLN